MDLSPIDRRMLINAIANREGTGKALSQRFGIPVAELRQFVEDNREEIEQAQVDLEEQEPEDLTPVDLDGLWITKKFERLRRMQEVAETTYDQIKGGNFMSAAEQAMAVREFRSYLMLAANELGQLLHRGSGERADGEVLSIEMPGIDMDRMQ